MGSVIRNLGQDVMSRHAKHGMRMPIRLVDYGEKNPMSPTRKSTAS